ncbi:MAG: FHA domain-containing protein [Deltaproteobacteria bacterium]|nr:FHA domain-containing protein [Deltaproteobacteria bacterium]
MHKLVISDDEGKTTIVPLIRDEITIGRKEGNTIRLTERNVSRRHARLVRANGSFQIEDLGSYNGIRLNGVRISDKSVIKEGDQVQIGDYQLALQSDKVVARVPEEQATVATVVPVAADGPTEMIPVPAVVETEPLPAPTPRPAQPARLVLLSAPAPGQEFPLDRDEVVIGRAEECEVSLNHRSISREHAKILRVDQAFRILDLESANGVRINGQDVPYSELRRGDLIELGHVRLRFVAPGETYRLDGDATIQMSSDVGRPGRGPLWVLAAALLVAGGVALYLAVRPADPTVEPDVPVTAPQQPAPRPPPAPPPPPAVHDVEALLREARELRDAGDLERAIERAAQAKSQAPGNREADAFLQQLQLEQRGKNQLEKGRALLPDYTAAFAEFETIPQGTPAYDDPEVLESARRVLSARLEEARELMRRGGGSLDDARQTASDVRDHPWVRDPSRAKLVKVGQSAEQILRQIAEREAATAVVAPGPHPPGPIRQPGPVRPPQPPETHEPPVQPPQQPTGSGETARCIPITSAERARCYLSATGGVAQGESGLRNLILAHSFIGDRGRVQNLARQYLEKFPDTPFARRVREMAH